MKNVLQMAGILHAQNQADDTDVAPRTLRAVGRSPVLLVCEHASARIPSEFHNLGLDSSDLTSHIAWDLGAFETARHLSATLDAALIYSTVSRLIYDCNRPPTAKSAVPERSEATPIPGNAGLSATDREARAERFYKPFERLLCQTLDQRPQPTALVTVHSFTPVYLNKRRTVEIGVLHDADSRLADALLDVASPYKVERNAPYGPEDGVMHTLREHALPRGILNVMIEVRNDLLSTPAQCAEMADTLAGWLTQALERCAPSLAQERRQ